MSSFCFVEAIAFAETDERHCSIATHSQRRRPARGVDAPLHQKVNTEYINLRDIVAARAWMGFKLHRNDITFFILRFFSSFSVFHLSLRFFHPFFVCHLTKCKLTKCECVASLAWTAFKCSEMKQNVAPSQCLEWVSSEFRVNIGWDAISKCNIIE